MYYRSSICITDPVSTCNYLSVSVLAVEKIMYQHVKVLQSVSVLKTFGCVHLKIAVHAYSNSNGENPVDLWGTSQYANKHMGSTYPSPFPSGWRISSA